MAGLTFALAKDSLRLVCDNGVGINDPRIMRRTNEATQEILAEIIPVNGMLTANVMTDEKGIFLCPAEMDSVIDVGILGDVSVYGQTDTRRGWYDIVNPATFVDPAFANDNPLVDLFYIADPNDVHVLRRRYLYPGLSEPTLLEITGPKSYRPITGDGSFLIVQNVPALKLMIQAIERRENNDVDGSVKYRSLCFELLQAEVKKHNMDPRRMMLRKSEYEADLRNFERGSLGWTRARLALEVPGAQSLGKEALARLIGRAEMRMMEMGIMKGCLEEFSAPVVSGHLVMPDRVEAILAANLCGQPVDVRSIFFKYLQDGPGDWDCTCGGRIEDEGDIVINGRRRRKYRLNTGSSQSSISAAVSSGQASGGSGDMLTAEEFLYIGSKARMSALDDGIALEIQDSGGNWVRQDQWTE